MDSKRPGPVRILVVDDHREAAELLAEYLTDEGFEVQRAADGEGALLLAVSFAPQVVLLDIGLPRMSGLEVARRLRELPGTRDSLLIALTGYNLAEERDASRLAGFDRHLLKPIDLEELKSVIAFGRPDQP